MIKGNLKDVSLPGLMQFLANEAGKNYRLKIDRTSLHGDLIIAGGDVISASYGLLTGEDALCEFLTWEDGSFWVERLPARLESTFFERNMQLRLQQTGSFADQSGFLLENQVGLNTVVRSSKMFGTSEWQESSKLHPLQREDFLVLGWLSEGRTMRQASREFAFDLIKSTGILYRLVLTRSVEIVRASDSTEVTQELESIMPTEPIPVLNINPVPPPPPIPQAQLPSSPATPPAAAPVTLSATPASVVAAMSAAVESPQPAAEESQRESTSNSRRTTVLPIISIDIERLMKATFTISEFGCLAMKNPALDENIRFVMLKTTEGQTIESVVDEDKRPAAVILATYRYCMDRGYISNPDSVLPLTADLLLKRTELDQYLLQRRRVTGEVLRDLSETARTDGKKMSEELIIHGFLSREDLDCVAKQQVRFATR